MQEVEFQRGSEAPIGSEERGRFFVGRGETLGCDCLEFGPHTGDAPVGNRREEMSVGQLACCIQSRMLARPDTHATTPEIGEDPFAR